MAIIEDLVEEALGPVAIGIGALLLVPRVFPAVGRAVRPIAKGVIKTGMSIYDQTVAAVTEATGDLVAEARAELESEARQTPKTQHQAAPAH